MEKKQWTLVNAENVVPYVCDETYSSNGGLSGHQHQ